MKYSILLSLFLGFANTLAGQSVLNRALDLYKAGEIHKAKFAIDSAMQQTEFQVIPESWYVRGFIYKDLYKANTRSTEFREESIESFVKLINLDQEKKYSKEAYQNIRFLTVSYYNEGMRFIEEERFDDALKSYERFDQLAKLLNDSSLNQPESKIKFYLVLGSSLMRRARNNNQEVSPMDAAVSSFEKVLEIDSLNREANYNIGVIYYNSAVNKILSLDYDALNFEEFSEFEDNIIKLFNKSLPYMKRAYRLNPHDSSTLEGLSGIYFGLRDFDTSNRYKNELNQQVKN